jgi:hypothetical protein
MVSSGMLRRVRATRCDIPEDTILQLTYLFLFKLIYILTIQNIHQTLDSMFSSEHLFAALSSEEKLSLVATQ